ncbi:MAG: hypothetical protein FWE22_06600 [Firmicutes bacterium]|nr:hypothetical protein [Bacillota bacterium]
MKFFRRIFKRQGHSNKNDMCKSNFVGTVGGDIASFVFAWKDVYNDKIVYTMTDDKKNIFIWETDETIENVDGKHYFLIEGKISEHKEIQGQKQTILSECKFEQIGKYYNIKGGFFGEIGDRVELGNAKVYFRKPESDFKVTGEIIKDMPKPQHRIIIERGENTFILPFLIASGNRKKITKNTTGRYNIYARVIGYTIENGQRATYLFPIRVECKNGPVYNGAIYENFRASGRFGATWK